MVSVVTTTTGAAATITTATAMTETTTIGHLVMIGGTLGIEETAHGHTLKILRIATTGTDVIEIKNMTVTTADMITVIAVMKVIILLAPVTRMSTRVAEVVITTHIQMNKLTKTETRTSTITD